MTRMPRNPTAKSRSRRRTIMRGMTQRLIAAVSAPTAEGVLYELDLRLRPSGNKGPVATHIDAFRKYQREDAWTWEHMALTRARAGRRRSESWRRDRSRKSPKSWHCRAIRQKIAAEAAEMRAHDREGEAAARYLGHQAHSGRPHRPRIHRAGGRADRQVERRGDGPPGPRRSWRGWRRTSPTARRGRSSPMPMRSIWR